MKMLGKIPFRCEFGCCRVIGKKGKTKERRWTKRGKKETQWKREEW